MATDPRGGSASYELPLALTLALFAIACTVGWMAAGAPVPTAGNPPSVATPSMRFLAYVGREGPQAQGGLVIMGLLALPITVASGIALLLLLRMRRSIHAQRLAMSLAAISAGFATLFVMPALVPDLRSSPLVLGVAGVAISCAGAALVGWGTWLLVRFWVMYPTPVDLAALGEFAARRGQAMEPHAWWTQRITTRWMATLGADHVIDSALGRFILAWSVAAVVVWSLVSLAGIAWFPETGRWAVFVSLFVLGMGGIVPVVTIVFMPTSLVVAELVHYRHASATEVGRRIAWLRVATEACRFLLANPFVWLAFGVVVLAVALMTPDEFGYGQLVSISAIFPITVIPTILVVGLGASILAHGLVDPALALRRVTLWTLLGLVITMLFVLVERFVALQVARWLSLPAETGALIGGTLVALTFVPIRRWGEKWVNQFVERQMPAHLLATGDRREGAVAVVDISGFTALSARDEASALLATALVQKDARKVVDAYAGRIVKTTGDGALMVFERATDAAAAVRELHASFERDALLLGLPPLKLHSGLSFGDYVDVRDSDIYGHTVNVASRVADSAAAGEILVTSAFAAALGQYDPTPVEIGARRFKNVPEAVVCLRL